MSGRENPPGGTPEGVPGGDDEYRSVVFDESFVRAARIQEYSAEERIGGGSRAVRTRPLWRRASGSRQVLLLILVIVLAFSTAIYLGVRNPYRTESPPSAIELNMTVIPLAPASAGGSSPAGRPTSSGPSPGAATKMFDSSPAAAYHSGAEGITIPATSRTDNFSQSQVLRALSLTKEYLVASSLDPDVLVGGSTSGVRKLLDPAQHDQFDSALANPSDDGQHAITGWLTRFDGSQVTLVDTNVRVGGSMRVSETGPDALTVTTDHTFVFAVRAAQSKSSPPMLFTVRRALTAQYDQRGLQDSHIALVRSATEAGPQSCSAETAAYFQPLLPGAKNSSGATAGTNPYDRGRPVASVCGVLDTSR